MRSVRPHTLRAVVGAVAVVLVACTSSGEADPGSAAVVETPVTPDPGPSDAVPSDTVPSGAAPGGVSPSELSDQVLKQAEAELAAQDPLGSAAGEVVLTSDGDRTQLATLDVLTVSRQPTATLVGFRLSADEPVDVAAVTFSPTAHITFRNLGLVDVTEQVRLHPFTFELPPGYGRCACSWVPVSLGPDGDTFYALFPPLPESSQTVSLELRGFDVVENLPVRE